MLVIGALLMVVAGTVFASTRQLWLLVLAGTIGVISPSGNEVGPFLSIEQAALSNVVTDRTRTAVFAWYSLTGSIATALGALAGGTVAGLLQTSARVGSVGSYRGVIVLYAILGLDPRARCSPVCRRPQRQPPSARRKRFRRRLQACPDSIARAAS